MLSMGVWILILLLPVVNMAAWRQQASLRPVTWSLVLSGDMRAGDSGVAGVAELRARIDPGWHLYSLTQPAGGPRATVIEVVGDRPFRLAGAVGCPAPETILDRTSTGVSELYSDSVTFRLPIASRSRLSEGKYPLVVAVTYQACSARLCLPPRTDSISVSATVVH